MRFFQVDAARPPGRALPTWGACALLGAWCAAGCSEYDFSKPTDAVVGGEEYETSGGSEGDPDSPDSGSAGFDDDTGIGDDPCYDPSTAYDMHPAAGLVVIDGGTAVMAIYDGSDAGYTSELRLASPDSLHIATGHVTPEGTRTALGTFATGTELVFTITVQDTGDVFYSGPASRNADNFLHSAVTYTGECTWTVGFEDLYGGGDQDFNDIMMTIEGELEMQVVL